MYLCSLLLHRSQIFSHPNPVNSLCSCRFLFVCNLIPPQPFDFTGLHLSAGRTFNRLSNLIREATAGERCCSNGILPNSVSISVIVKCDENKTQYQPCKDWLGQLFLIPGLVWKMVSPFHRWMCSLSGSQQPFSCVLGHFRHGD